MAMSFEDAVNELTDSFQTMGQTTDGLGGGPPPTRPKSPEPFDEDDPKIWAKTALTQLKALQTAVSVPLFSIVQTFEGTPNNSNSGLGTLRGTQKWLDLGTWTFPKLFM